MPLLPVRHHRRCPPRAGSSAPGSASIVSQREKEGGSFIDGGFGPDTATVSRDDPLHGRQADPGALKLRILVQSLKRREELVDVCHVESGTVIPNVENGLVILVL